MEKYQPHLNIALIRDQLSKLNSTTLPRYSKPLLFRLVLVTLSESHAVGFRNRLMKKNNKNNCHYTEISAELQKHTKNAGLKTIWRWDAKKHFGVIWQPSTG